MTATDLTAVRASDALLDTLGGRTPQTPVEAACDPLSPLLVAFRTACHTEPAPLLVSTRRAMWLLRRARWTARATRFLTRLARRTR